MKNFVFLGAPGVGKGTMSKAYCADRRYSHISTGDLLRAEVAAGSELGKTAKGYMESGKLVPDTLVAELLANALRKSGQESNGAIFDGYPRTVPQAEMLANTLEEVNMQLTGVVLLEAMEEIVLMRLTGRRLCRACGAIYHLQFSPPKVAGTCDKCGGEIYQRADDNEVSVKQRLVEYENQTSPLIDYYAERNLLIRVDASRDKDANYQALCAGIDGYLAARKKK